MPVGLPSNEGQDKTSDFNATVHRMVTEIEMQPSNVSSCSVERSSTVPNT